MPSKKYIPIAEPDLTGREKEYLIKCIDSNWVSSKGEFIDKFEYSFSKYIGTKYAIATCNGTAALHLALLGLEVGRGDEVIVPDLTFVASVNSIFYTGATPVLVDIDRETWNIDPDQIERKISHKTKAIMVVHLYGNPADMVRIMALAKRYNLYIIEDAAEAHGAEIRINNQINTNDPMTQSTNKKRLRHLGGGRLERSESHDSPDGGGTWRKVGSIGNIGCFSFYGNKIITTGEGGMVVTNNKKLADRIKILRDHGQDPQQRYYYKVIGFNNRMTNLQAAVGLAQLERIDLFIKKKIQIAKMYDRLLNNIKGITLPTKNLHSKNVYWMYSILVDKPYPLTSNQLMKVFGQQNIEVRPFFHPIHTLPPYKSVENFPNASYVGRHGISLPSGISLKDQDMIRIADIIKKYSK